MQLTTHHSLKLLTRQLGSVVGHGSDNPIQRFTFKPYGKELARCSHTVGIL
jgi:hypothetical protein